MWRNAPRITILRTFQHRGEIGNDADSSDPKAFHESLHGEFTRSPVRQAVCQRRGELVGWRGRIEVGKSRFEVDSGSERQNRCIQRGEKVALEAGGFDPEALFPGAYRWGLERKRVLIDRERRQIL